MGRRRCFGPLSAAMGCSPDLAEMRAIQAYFLTEGRLPTDGRLERWRKPGRTLLA
ncbi:MAG: hypothetical protein U0074_05210 [Kouleothrix sp.]